MRYIIREKDGLEWIEPDPGYIEAFRGLTQLIASNSIAFHGYVEEGDRPFGTVWLEMFNTLKGEEDSDATQTG